MVSIFLIPAQGADFNPHDERSQEDDGELFDFDGLGTFNRRIAIVPLHGLEALLF